MTLALANEHSMGMILDLSAIPRSLWDPSGADPSSEETLDDEAQGQLMRAASRALTWRGAQRGVGWLILGLFGRRGAQYDTPNRHSSWRETSQDEPPPAERSALRAALSAQPLRPLTRTRALTILAPAALLTTLERDLCSSEAFDAYERAMWVPRVLYYDWTLGDMDVSTSLDQQIPPLGELDLFMRALIARLLELRSRSPELVASLLRDRLRGLADQPLSLIGARDLISATILIHQRGHARGRYWARGEQLTWGSFTQMCAHCVDDLDDARAAELTQLLSPRGQGHGRSPWWSLSVEWLKSRATHKRSSTDELIAELRRLASTPRGGPAPQARSAQLEALPSSFNWTPAHTLIADVLERTIKR
jgi:hypothetical protein